MGDELSGKILGATDQLTNYWLNLNFKENPFAIMDILIVAMIIYWGYLLIKETRALHILYGILFLGLIMLLGQVLGLLALNFIVKYLITMITVAIPIVFQPELRAALEKLGRTKIVGDFTHLKKNEIERVVEEIVKVAKILTKNKTGALIVLAQKTGIKNIIDSGVRVSAEVTPELLLSIFFPNSPLHDGAVIISGNKIIAAGCMLPLSEEEFDFKIGTRHRAAVGLSSQSDAIVIVISEERSTISVAFNGQLSREVSPKELEEFILTIINHKNNSKNNTSKNSDSEIEVNEVDKLNKI